MEPKDEQELLRNILRRVAVFLRDSVLLFDAVLVNAGAIQPASTENVIQGPDDSFTENIEVNLNLIRHRYQTANLKTEFMTVGKLSQTRIIIMYDACKVDETVLQELKSDCPSSKRILCNRPPKLRDTRCILSFVCIQHSC